MKVLVVSASYPPAADGEAEHALQIAQRLAAAGHAATVLTQCRNGVAQVDGVRVLPDMRGWRWRDLPRLAWLLATLRPDGVVLIYTARLFGEHPMITFLPTLLRWVRPAARLAVVVEIERAPYIRGRAARLGRRVLAALAGGAGVHWGYGTLLRDSHAVAALGPTILARLVEHDASVAQRGWVMPPPPLVTRPAGADAAMREAARARLGIAHDDFLLAYFGFVYPGKGIETLLDAVARLRGQGRHVRLLMGGGGRGLQDAGAPGEHGSYEAAMMARCSELHIGDAVLWPPGYPSGSDGAAFDLLAADAAVLPFDDGAELRRSSIAVMAGMGLPLLTTLPLGAEPAFVHEDTVLLSPPRDVDALCLGIQRLQDDDALRRRLSAGAQALHQRWFSWDVAIGAIAAALRTPARG